MINRYTLDHNKTDIEEYFGIELSSDFSPIYNAHPRKHLPILTNFSTSKTVDFSWGLIPNNAIDAQIALKLCITRAKTILAKSPYCDLIATQRCIILADSFFAEKDGQYYRFTTKDKAPFGIAGIYNQTGKQEDGSFMFESFSMIQTPASISIADQTELMPAILAKEMFGAWLSDSQKTQALQNLLIPYSRPLDYYRVSDTIVDIDTNTSKTITPFGETPSGESLSLF